VASEWHHTVSNERDTLSVNSNWFNRHSLRFVYRRFMRDAAKSKEAATVAAHVSHVHALRKTRRTLRTLAAPFLSGTPESPPSVVGNIEQLLLVNYSSSCVVGETSDTSEVKSAAVATTLGEKEVAQSFSSSLPSSSAVQQPGKPAFDVSDFVRLLAWKTEEAETVLRSCLIQTQQHTFRDQQREDLASSCDTTTTTALSPTVTPSRTDAMVADLKEIVKIADLIARDTGVISEKGGKDCDGDHRNGDGGASTAAAAAPRDRELAGTFGNHCTEVGHQAIIVQGRATQALSLWVAGNLQGPDQIVNQCDHK